MLSERRLILGLNALSRAHASDHFGDGHRGAAMVSAAFLCAENAIEEEAAQAIGRLIDAHWAHTALCEPVRGSAAKRQSLDLVAAALEANCGHLRQAGHNVIFASLALKALAQLPKELTRDWAHGIVRLIERFTTVDDVPVAEGDPLPPLNPLEPFAGFVLRETLRTMRDFEGRGQGWSGHMLTYGRAMLDLVEGGWQELAGKCLPAFAMYVARTRQGPLESDTPRPEHPASDLRPLAGAYWERRAGQDPGLGHCIKYPYGFYGLLRLVRDDGLREKCLRESYRVL